jgi:hypothetical protein
MVPASEMNEVHADAAAAVSLAVAGEAADGAAVLLGGLHRAEALLGQETWAEALAACYRKALSAYCRRYHLSLEPVVPAPATGSWIELPEAVTHDVVS